MCTMQYCMCNLMRCRSGGILLDSLHFLHDRIPIACFPQGALLLPQSCTNSLDILDGGCWFWLLSSNHVRWVIPKTLAVVHLGSDHSDTVLLNWVECKGMTFCLSSRALYPCHLLWSCCRCLLGSLCGGLEHAGGHNLIVSGLANREKCKRIRSDGSGSLLYPGGLLWSLLGDGLGGSVEHGCISVVVGWGCFALFLRGDRVALWPVINFLDANFYFVGGWRNLHPNDAIAWWEFSAPSPRVTLLTGCFARVLATCQLGLELLTPCNCTDRGGEI